MRVQDNISVCEKCNVIYKDYMYRYYMSWALFWVLMLLTVLLVVLLILIDKPDVKDVKEEGIKKVVRIGSTLR